jgi:hypothetical protein
LPVFYQQRTIDILIRAVADQSRRHEAITGSTLVGGALVVLATWLAVFQRKEK